MEKEKSGSRYFTTMRNTWLCPRSVLWEYWTPLVACLVWIQYSCGMPHVIRIGKVYFYFYFLFCFVYFSTGVERVADARTYTHAHTPRSGSLTLKVATVFCSWQPAVRASGATALVATIPLFHLLN